MTSTTFRFQKVPIGKTNTVQLHSKKHIKSALLGCLLIILNIKVIFLKNNSNYNGTPDSNIDSAKKNQQKTPSTLEL